MKIIKKWFNTTPISIFVFGLRIFPKPMRPAKCMFYLIWDLCFCVWALESLGIKANLAALTVFDGRGIRSTKQGYSRHELTIYSRNQSPSLLRSNTFDISKRGIAAGVMVGMKGFRKP